MMMLMAAAWACEPEVCVEQARVARGELRLSESAELFQTACEGGDPEGCAGAAFALKYGNGVKKDEERPAKRLRLAHRARSRMLHPDLHPNGELDEGLPTIHDVNVAYECLKTLLV